MKLSVSLSEEDVEFLDEYAKSLGMASRSAVIKKALGLLRASQLGAAYARAWEEWEAGDDSDLWDSASEDGQ